MIRSLTGKKLIAAVVSACVSLSALAGSWDWSRPFKGPRSTISTVLIVPNYNLPRILGDLIQNETSQPYLLIPSKGQNRIFFCPGHNKDAMEIRMSDFTRFISFLNPQQVIVLGDERYVPAKYVKAIPPNYTTMIIYNNDWEKVAKTLSGFFNKQNIYYDFQELSKNFLHGNLYVPTKTKPQAAAPAAPTTPVSVPATVSAPAASETTVPALPETAAPATVPATTATETPAPPTGKPAVAPAPSPNEPELITPEGSPVLVEEKH